MERSSASEADVESDRVHPIFRVRDVARAVEFYREKLGFRVAFVDGDPPTFAGVNLGHVQLFLEKGDPGPDGAAAYFVVDDADALNARHREAGARPEMLTDQPWGLRDYGLRDPDGNRLSFGHPIHTTGPRVHVERVDVAVRLEKRLAALLADLAEHKRMSVGECLEEILLHTNDGVDPHTPRQLAHIKELKRRHGIDYDTHASYRFAEKADASTSGPKS